jgi:uncharacterized membrane protein
LGRERNARAARCIRVEQEETSMLRNTLIASALALGLAVPAFAQTTTEFYVVQDASTKKCTIVDKKPTTQTTVVVGDGKVFKTRTEAETGMKQIKVCSN